ncbi:hypothetical protein, partial [Treponema berlinense]|uniref:hypothetical protein n=1 Tax=Treponema berlinense TaxID=225004 RepID=UPI0023537F24
MKRLKTLILAFSLVAALLITGCSDGSSGGTENGSDNTGTNTGGSGDPVLSNVVKSGLKFDFSNAKAIAAVDKDSLSRAVYSRNARAVEDSPIDDSPLLKILEDGSFESAITLAENANLATIKAIYKSPLEGSNDIFVVFDGQSWFYDTKVTVDENGNEIDTQTEYKTLGQLICIHEDNTIADILKITDSSDTYNTGYQNLDTGKGIMFDASGNLYYMARTYNSSGEISCVYKFEPETNEITQLTSAVPGTYYNSFKISADGQIIFVQGTRWSSNTNTTFLRAIPVQDPNNFSNIYYSSTSSSLKSWVYDENKGIMYYVTGKGLFKSKRNGNSFEDAEFMGYSTSSDLGYFSYFNLESMIVAEWTRSDLSYYNGTESLDIKIVDENGSLIPEKVAEYLVASARSYSEGYISISTDDVDIRFDVFKDIEGYEEIYEATKGLKNATAIKALDTFRLRNMLYDVFYYGYYSSGKNYVDNYRAYNHNFLADILYVKGTDTLLCNSNEPVNDSSQVKGTEYFRKTSDGFYATDGNVIGSLMKITYEYGCVSVNNSYQKSDGSIDSSKILKDAFSKCHTSGEKEFRLDCFKNDDKYGMLYSQLTDEEALDWIFSDEERMFWFGNAINTYINAYYEFSDFFYIKGTDKPAYKPKSIGASYSIIKDYTISEDGSLWGRYENISDSYASEKSEKYFYFVQITDSDGWLINEFNKVDLPEGKVAETIEDNGSLYMKYALLNSNGEETGYHQIYKVDFSDSSHKNLFDNVPNRERLEVVSFSV